MNKKTMMVCLLFITAQVCPAEKALMLGSSQEELAQESSWSSCPHFYLWGAAGVLAASSLYWYFRAQQAQQEEATPAFVRVYLRADPLSNENQKPEDSNENQHSLKKKKRFHGVKKFAGKCVKGIAFLGQLTED